MYTRVYKGEPEAKDKKTRETKRLTSQGVEPYRETTNFLQAGNLVLKLN